MAFGNGASVDVVLTFVPGAPSGRLQDDADSGVRLVRLTSGAPGVVDSPSSDCAPRNTSNPLSDGGWILDGQVSVVVPDRRSCVTDRLMSVPSPLNTWIAGGFEPGAGALLVPAGAMVQGTGTREAGSTVGLSP